MNFTKLHGAGNDFIVVDAREHTRDWTKLAIALCDRHVGVGAVAAEAAVDEFAV